MGDLTHATNLLLNMQQDSFDTQITLDVIRFLLGRVVVEDTELPLNVNRMADHLNINFLRIDIVPDHNALDEPLDS